MKPALAKTPEKNALEDIGRATLQVVHDLKNQLNGIKLYATFLRKRFEREEQATEERETLAKLIAGLDRAARDMTALVRYSQPVELRQRPHSDLRPLIESAVRDATARPGAGAALACGIESGPLYGEFDSAALAEALQALTEEAVKNLPSNDFSKATLHAHREVTPTSSQAVIEWRGVRLTSHHQSFHSSTNYGTVYTAQAARIIEAHGGQFEIDANTIRVRLPLSE